MHNDDAQRENASEVVKIRFSSSTAASSDHGLQHKHPFELTSVFVKRVETMMNLSSNVTLKELPYTQTSEAEFSLWTQPVPFSFTEWKTILSQWTMKKPIKFSSSFSFPWKSSFYLDFHQLHPMFIVKQRQPQRNPNERRYHEIKFLEKILSIHFSILHRRIYFNRQSVWIDMVKRKNKTNVYFLCFQSNHFRCTKTHLNTCSTLRLVVQNC